MTWCQLTSAVSYMLAALRRQGYNQADTGRLLGCHRSKICRELRRNNTRADGRYRVGTA